MRNGRREFESAERTVDLDEIARPKRAQMRARRAVPLNTDQKVQLASCSDIAWCARD